MTARGVGSTKLVNMADYINKGTCGMCSRILSQRYMKENQEPVETHRVSGIVTFVIIFVYVNGLMKVLALLITYAACL